MAKRKMGRPAVDPKRKKSRPITFKVQQAFAVRLEQAAKQNGLSLSNEIGTRLDAGETDEAWNLARDLVAVIRLIGSWGNRADVEKLEAREAGYRKEAHEARNNPRDGGVPVEPRTAKERYADIYEGAQAKKIRQAVHIIVDAHTEGKIPEDLLESKRHGSTEARLAAFTILRNRHFNQRQKP
jgi:hypothetical protein